MCSTVVHFAAAAKFNHRSRRTANIQPPQLRQLLPYNRGPPFIQGTHLSAAKRASAQVEITVAMSKSSGTNFFMCYLLRSLNVKHPKSTYIGFTVHPKRRIRQHNGEISGGAFRTRKKRPWDMGCVVQGFPNKVSALQFEYAWTNPNRSRLLKGFVGKTKKYGFNNKMELLAILLSVEPFANYGLSVHCQHEDVLGIWNKIVDSSKSKKGRKGRNTDIRIKDLSHLKDTVQVSVGPLDDLKVYQDQENVPARSNTMRSKPTLQSQAKDKRNVSNMDWPDNLSVNLDNCVFCDDLLNSSNGYAKCPNCQVKGHLVCMSEKLLYNDPLSLLPKQGVCPICDAPVKWSNMIVRGNRTITPRQSPQRRNTRKTKSTPTKRVHIECEQTVVLDITS